MFKRFVMLILMLMGFILLFCGCLGQTSQNDAKLPKEIPSDKEVVKEMTKGKIASTTSDQDEDILELKHWKYGSEKNADMQEKEEPVDEQSGIRPTPYPGSEGDYSKTVTIQILSEEEMHEIIKSLVDFGYLKEEVCSREEFEKALLDFQDACGLKTTGEPDAETLRQLKLMNKKSGS